MSIKIVGIDPGPEVFGIAQLFEGKVLMTGNITSPFDPMFIDAFSPDIIAIEVISSFGMAVGKSVFDTCINVGRITERYETKGYKVVHIPRATLKKIVLGSVKGNDAAIRKRMIEVFKIENTRSITKHAWQALAVAYAAGKGRNE